MPWDPEQYRRFSDHRSRPGLELIERIPQIRARRIVDLGCGSGHLTAVLSARWPDAEVIGLDSSEDMLEVARADHPTLNWILGDIIRWEPDGPVDLVFANASLHWLTDHAVLFPRLSSWLGRGGVMAVQMPNNWSEPTHQIPAAILDDGTWPEEARAALIRDRVASPISYLDWVPPADLWETTYYQRLTGDDPVLEWVKGSVLRPVIDALGEPRRSDFVERCRHGYSAAYPRRPDGSTVLPFRRLFLVATEP